PGSPRAPCPADAAVHTLRYKQSSLASDDRKIMSSQICTCIGRSPKAVASRTPAHGLTGCGSLHRSSPTGGAAYGIPLKTRTPLLSRAPRTTPLAVLTSSEASPERTPAPEATPETAAETALKANV